jgi:hypothetical protein
VSAPSRRRPKVKPAPKGRVTFTIVVEAQKMVVDYQPNWMADTGHFDFRSPYKPARRIPVSETGYRSYFAPMGEVKAASSPQDYAREVAVSMIRATCKPCPEREVELPLF